MEADESLVLLDCRLKRKHDGRGLEEGLCLIVTMLIPQLVVSTQAVVTSFLVTWVGEASVPTKLDVVLGLAHGLVVVAKSVRLGVAVGSLDDDVLRRTKNHWHGLVECMPDLLQRWLHDNVGNVEGDLRREEGGLAGSVCFSS